jgi:hypothetical protein
MTMDRYTKIILTIIAIGIIGINFHLYDVNFIKKANAVSINVAVNQIEEIIEDNTKIILKAIQKACN